MDDVVSTSRGASAEAASGARPRRAVKLSLKAKEQYEADKEERCTELHAAWSNVERVLQKLSGAEQREFETTEDTLRASFAEYKDAASKYEAFLVTTNCPESLLQRDQQRDIDAQREELVMESLDKFRAVRNTARDTASQSSRSVRSERSSSSQQTSSSTITVAAAQARAAAEAAKAKVLFSRKEAAMKVERAKLDAELEILHHEKEAAAADAQAGVLEAAAEQDGGESLRALPLLDSNKRTEGYVLAQATTHDPRHVSSEPRMTDADHGDVHDEVNVHARIMGHQTSRQVDQRSMNALASGGTSSEMAGVVKFLCRKDLLSIRMTRFDDRPDGFRAWASSFKAMTSGLDLSAQEELDLLIKWLGPESSAQSSRLRSVYVQDYEAGLNAVWKRLNDTYGSPEVVEDALMKRLEDFPRIPYRDNVKLRELGDLLLELETAKTDPYLPGLKYLDTARGVNAIVAKLPPGLQEKWMSVGSKYKKDNNTAFPPFSFFSKFVRDEAEMRNDPSFILRPQNTLSDIQQRREKQASNAVKGKTTVSSRKTDVDSKPESCYATTLNADGQKEKELRDLSKWCPIHKRPHSLEKCRVFLGKTFDDSITFLRKRRICFKCLKSTSHFSKQCETAVRCSVCDSTEHHAALHPTVTRTYSPPKTAEEEDNTQETGGSVTATRTEVGDKGDQSRSCARICLVNVTHDGQPHRAVKAYAILDDQSNRSLVTSELLDLFRVDGVPTGYTLRTCSGITEVTARLANGFSVQSLSGDVDLKLPPLLECSDIPNSRSEIPTPEAARCYPHLQSIASFIPPLEPEAEISLLLGRDVIRAHKVRQTCNGPHDAPYAQKHDLGWVIVGNICIGRTRKPGTISVLKTYIFSNGRPSLLEPCDNHFVVKEHPILASPGRHDPTPDYGMATEPKNFACTLFQTTSEDNELAPSIEDRAFLDIMENEFVQDQSNSWVGPLPFRTPRPRLPNNRQQALSRLLGLRRTLRRNPEMNSHFMAFMKELFVNDYAEPVPPLADGKECWYLPLFGVYHPHKPEKIRVVFDSSAQYKGVSLNSVLLTGPDLTNSLIGVLIRFRKEQVAVMADIQQMFYSFFVREDHRDFLRFLWFENNDMSKEIVEYRMKVHVFGNSPSPAVATYGLRRTARQGLLLYGEEAAKFVERDFYVDDGLKSVPTEEDAINLLRNTQEMLATANIRLHKIASNRENVLKAFPVEDHAKDLRALDFTAETMPAQRSLGLLWNVREDTFVYRAPPQGRPCTRRGVLSTVNGLYDPLGFVAPVTARAKHFLREITAEGYDWDAPLPAHRAQDWEEWKSSLGALEDLQIPRTYAASTMLEAERKEIHIFCDASTKAVAAVAYLRLVDKKGTRHVGFIMGKTKLAPLAEPTVPRLELCGAVLAVELAELVQRELDIQADAVKFYIDSKVVLGYIYNETRRFYVYVANRVLRIRKTTRPEQWKYIHTSENPADHGTRMVSAMKLEHTTWLSGPDFLRQDDEPALPSPVFNLVSPSEDRELRPEVNTLATAITTSRQLGAERFLKFSSWKTLVRAVAFLLRAAQRVKGLTAQESAPEYLSTARSVVIRAVQRDCFSQEISLLEDKRPVPKKSPLRRLDPFIDGNGLVRVGGRLRRGDLPEEEKHPVIIPSRHHVATLLIRYYHEQVQHQGRHFTEGAVRSAGLWIIGGKGRISSIVGKCVTCKKLRGRSQEQKMADLPVDRLTTEPPFTNVAVDVFGPWLVVARRTRGGMSNTKRWAVLFTCLSIRAVHIEVIEAMDTSSFINALRRFLAIRGPVKQIRSDCGTNFVGACREMGINPNDLGSSTLGTFLNEKGCTWVFNPPHGSHMGGVWERMIGIARRILDSMLLQTHHNRLTHEVLTTFMAEVSAIINARPLVPVSSDPENPIILTPTAILTQKLGASTSAFGEALPSNLYRRQWHQVQNLASEFWKKWRTGYLTTLQQRRKWQIALPDLKVGDFVLLKEKQANRCEWPVGVIAQCILSADGHIRRAEVKTAKNGIVKMFIRPISDIVRLMTT